MIRAMRSAGEMQANDLDRREGRPAAAAWRRWAYAALAAAAVISLVASLAPDSYQLLGPYPLIDTQIVLTAVEAVLPFVLVAALLYGADGWPGGRSLLWWGAGALALAAGLELVLELMFAFMSETVTTAEPLNVPLFVRYFVALGTTAAGFGLLAAGLWKGRRTFAMRPAPPGGGLAMGLVAAAAVVAVVADLWAAVPLGAGLPPELLAVAAAGGLLMAMMSVGLAALAIVALRITPSEAGLPEVLIAAGATLVMLARAGAWALPYALLSGTESAPLTSAIFLLVRVAENLGMVGLSAGFVLAGLTIRVEPGPSQPEAA